MTTPRRSPERLHLTTEVAETFATLGVSPRRHGGVGFHFPMNGHLGRSKADSIPTTTWVTSARVAAEVMVTCRVDGCFASQLNKAQYYSLHSNPPR